MEHMQVPVPVTNGSVYIMFNTARAHYVKNQKINLSSNVLDVVYQHRYAKNLNCYNYLELCWSLISQCI